MGSGSWRRFEHPARNLEWLGLAEGADELAEVGVRHRSSFRHAVLRAWRCSGSAAATQPDEQRIQQDVDRRVICPVQQQVRQVVEAQLADVGESPAGGGSDGGVEGAPAPASGRSAVTEV